MACMTLYVAQSVTKPNIK